VTSNFAFLVPTLAYDPTNVILTLTNAGALFSSVAETSNQFNVANAVSVLGFGNPIFDAVLSRSAPEARLAFDRLSNEVSASTITATFEVAGIVREAILGRVRAMGAPTFGGLGLGPTASVDAAYAADLPGRRGTTPVPVRTLDPRVFALWGQGLGSFGATGSDGNAGRLTRETGGFVVGADATLDGITRFGLAAGYTSTSLDVRSRLSSGEMQSGFGALYAGTSLGPVSLRFGGVYAGTWADTRRTIAFPGFSNSVRGRFGGDVGQVFGEAGYKVPLGAVTLEPFAGLAGVFISRDRYTETGGIGATTVFGRGYDLGVVTAGLRAEAALSTEWPLHLRGLVGYRHAFGDVVPRALLAFAGTAATFGVAGVPVDRHAVVAEAGLDWRVSNDLTVGLAYAGQAGDRAYDHGVKGSFLWKF
jgi:subtilase-type serine protease